MVVLVCIPTNSVSETRPDSPGEFGMQPRDPCRPWSGTLCPRRGLSSCDLQAPENRLNNCGARAQSLLSTWDLPGLGIKPVSSTSAGRFFTTEPPGKPYNVCSCNVLPDRADPGCVKRIFKKQLYVSLSGLGEVFYPIRTVGKNALVSDDQNNNL